MQATTDSDAAVSTAPSEAATATRVNGDVPTQAETDEQVFRMWLHGKSENTRKAYRRDVEGFFEKAQAESLRDVTLAHLQEHADRLEERGLAESTRNRKLAAIKSLFTFAANIGYVRFNPGKALSLPSVPNELSERILSRRETWRLLGAPDSLRNRAMLLLAYASGGRVSELARLKWKDTARRETPGGEPSGQITLLGKGEKTRSILLPRATWALLLELREEEREAGHGAPEAPVFRSRQGGHLDPSSIWRVVRKAAEKAGIEKPVSPHWFRHAHVSHALRKGAPVQLVKETTGHASLATVSKYAHARPDDSSGQYLDL